MKHYEQYKPSGIEWLGEVPANWNIERLKTSAKYMVSNVDKILVKDEIPIKLCNYTDVYNYEFITPNLDLMIGTATVEEIIKFKLEVDDVIITKDSEEWDDIGISAYVKETTDDLVCGYHLAIIRSFKNILTGQYLNRLLQSKEVNHQFQIAANGVTRFGLPKDAIGEALITLPSLPEQQAIAEYLDKKKGLLDELIKKKERMIELLHEERTAIISQAVTKGLNPNAPMKPSGVEWLGDIPEHWTMSKLSYLTTRIGSGKTPLGGANVYKSDGVVFIRSQNVHDDGLYLDDVVYIDIKTDEEMACSRVQANDILLNITGASLGRTCIVPENISSANVNQHVCIIRLQKKDFAVFVSYYLKSKIAKCFYDYVQTGAARDGLNFEQIASFPIPLPPLSEQQEIAEYLDQKTAQIDSLVSITKQEIEKLKEYRQTLISQAVTGKIKVCD